MGLLLHKKQIIGIVITILVMMLSRQIAFGQQLSNLIPPSPSAMQFLKYADYPVSNFTGIPDIKIPLYEINDGDLNLPIYLQYHASGTKPSDPNGVIAIGWSLVCGATVYRTIVNRPDDNAIEPIANLYNKAQLDNMTIPQRDSYLKAWELYGDTEPDVFSYNVAGISGKFVLKRDLARTPMLMPFKPIKITMAGALKILDPKGLQYEFSSIESTENSTTGWGIKKITSAQNPLNTINVTYVQGPNEYVGDRIDYYNLDDNGSNPSVTSLCNSPNSEDPIESYMPNSTPDKNPYSTGRWYARNAIKEINFGSGKIVFFNDPETKMLQNIKIYDTRGVLLKQIVLQRVLKTANKYLLKEVKFLNSAGSFVNSYKMKYHQEDTGSIPYDSNTDLWGYLTTGSSANMFPPFTITFSNPNGSTLARVLGSNTRTTDEEMMKMFVLKEIMYPTGGFSEFDYEANKRSGAGNSYSNYYSSLLVGGLRVKSISSYKAAGAVPEVKAYTYGTVQNRESGIGIMDIFPTVDDFRYTQRTYIADDYSMGNFRWESFRNNYFLSNPYTNITPQGSPVIYTAVTEYNGTPTNNLGKTEYYYSYEEPVYARFDNNGNEVSTTTPYYKNKLLPFKSWLSGNLTGKVYYKKVGNIYIPSQAEYIQYTETNRESLSALYMERFITYSRNHCVSTIPASQFDTYVYSRGTPLPISVFNYGDYQFVSSHYEVSKTGVSQYDDNGNLEYSKETDYVYENPAHGMLTKKKVATSDAGHLVTTYTYPHDYSGNQVYDEMVNNKHIWSVVIEQKEYLADANANLTELSALRNNYAIWNNNVSNIQLESVETSKSAGIYEPRIRYHAYDDFGNVKTVAKENGMFVNYIWGYGGKFPIAKVENTDGSWVENLLGGAIAVNNFANKLNPTDSEINSFVLPLRNSLNADQHVHTYTYAPLKGITSYTNPRGKKTFNEYDGFQRLKAVKDNSGYLLNAYDYQFKP